MTHTPPSLIEVAAWARFHFHTNPETSEGIESLAEDAVLAALAEAKLPHPSDIPHWDARREHLSLCAEEFYLVGEVVAVPQADKLPLIINPSQVSVIAKYDGSYLLHWASGALAKTLPSHTLYLRRPATPYDMRGVSAVQAEGLVEPSKFDTDLFVQQAAGLVKAIMTVNLGPEHVLDGEDEDTGEGPQEG